MTGLQSFLIAAMPDDLADAVGRLDINRRNTAMRGWLAVGVGGRQRHSDFVITGSAGWTRRLRCQLVMRRLIKAAPRADT